MFTFSIRSLSCGHKTVRLLQNRKTDSSRSNMALVQCATVNVDFSLPEHKKISSNIDDIFKQTGPKLYLLVLKNAEHIIFPVESVDAYLREHPENVKNVTHLNLNFDPCNSVQLLEMVSNRFPKIERLIINFSDNHPIEHVLIQIARMSNLIEFTLSWGFKKLYDVLQTHRFEPFTKIQILYSGPCCPADRYEHFEAITPVLFPNIVELHIFCPSKEFTDKVETNVRKLFPKLQICDAVDCEILN